MKINIETTPKKVASAETETTKNSTPKEIGGMEVLYQELKNLEANVLKSRNSHGKLA